MYTKGRIITKLRRKSWEFTKIKQKFVKKKQNRKIIGITNTYKEKQIDNFL